MGFQASSRKPLADRRVGVVRSTRGIATETVRRFQIRGPTLPVPQQEVSTVSAVALLQRAALTVGAEREAVATFRTAGRAAVRQQLGPGQRAVHLCRNVMRPRVRS